MTVDIANTAWNFTAVSTSGNFESDDPNGEGGTGNLLFTPDYLINFENATLGQKYSGSATDQWTDASEDTIAQNTEVLHGTQAMRCLKLAGVTILDFDSGGTYEPQVGDPILGEDTSATGTVEEVQLDSGSWAAGTATGSIIYGLGTGSLSNTENLTINGNVNNATMTGKGDGGGFGRWGGRKQLAVPSVKGDIVHAQFSVLLPSAFDWAADPWLKFFRFLISASNDAALGHLDMYIHNDNPGSDPNGNLAYHSEVWPYSLAFNSGGTYVPQVDDTLLGETSGATAVIKEVQLLSGSWAGGDAQGNFKYVSEVGDLQTAENLTINGNVNNATTTNSGVAGGTADIIPSEIMSKAVWETFEMQITLDDVEVDRGGNGRVRIWRNKGGSIVDGERIGGAMTLIGDYTDLPTLQESTDKCPTVLMFTYWNSGPENGTYPGSDQTCYGDRVVIQQDQSKLVETDAGGNKIIGGLK